MIAAQGAQPFDEIHGIFHQRHLAGVLATDGFTNRYEARGNQFIQGGREKTLGGNRRLLHTISGIRARGLDVVEEIFPCRDRERLPTCIPQRQIGALEGTIVKGWLLSIPPVEECHSSLLRRISARHLQSDSYAITGEERPIASPSQRGGPLCTSRSVWPSCSVAAAQLCTTSSIASPAVCCPRKSPASSRTRRTLLA